MFARQKVELLRSYAKKHWTEQAQEDLKPLFDEALVLIDYRNDFAHGVIMHDENGKWGVITFRGVRCWPAIMRWAARSSACALQFDDGNDTVQGGFGDSGT